MLPALVLYEIEIRSFIACNIYLQNKLVCELLPLLSCSAPVTQSYFHILLTFRNDWGVYGIFCVPFSFSWMCVRMCVCDTQPGTICVETNSKEHVVHLLHHWEYHNEHSVASKICWNHKPFVIGFDLFAKLHIYFGCATIAVCICMHSNRQTKKMVSITCID